jgi:hypothetical protein
MSYLIFNVHLTAVTHSLHVLLIACGLVSLVSYFICKKFLSWVQDTSVLNFELALSKLIITFDLFERLEFDHTSLFELVWSCTYPPTSARRKPKATCHILKANLEFASSPIGSHCKMIRGVMP